MTVQISFKYTNDGQHSFVEISAKGINDIRTLSRPPGPAVPIAINIPNGQNVNLVLNSDAELKSQGFGFHSITQDETTIGLQAESANSPNQVLVDFQVTFKVVQSLNINVEVSDDFKNWSYSQANEVVGMFYDPDYAVTFLLPQNFVRFVLVKAPAGYDWDPEEPVVWVKPTWIGAIGVQESDLSFLDQGGPSGAAAYLQVSDSGRVPHILRSPDPTLVNRGAPDDPDELPYSNVAFAQNSEKR